MDMVLQPKPSKVCGHCCVAMIAKVSLAEVVRCVGHSKGTKTRELVAALNHFGIKCGTRLQRGTLPPFSIAKIDTGRRSAWHWGVIKDNILYCPTWGMRSLESYEAPIISYLKIEIE